MSKLLLLSLFSFSSAFGAVAPLYIVHSNPPNKWSGDIEQGLKKALSPGRFDPVARYFFHNVYWLTRPPEEQKKEKRRMLELIAASKPAADRYTGRPASSG